MSGHDEVVGRGWRQLFQGLLRVYHDVIQVFSSGSYSGLASMLPFTTSKPQRKVSSYTVGKGI